MRKFKTGAKVKPSKACKEKWQDQVRTAKFGVVQTSVYDGTKGGGFAYTIGWDNGIHNSYRDIDVEAYGSSQLENK